MESQVAGPVISLMLGVPDTPSAVAWYRHALGATELWNLGSVAGLEIGGACFFLAEPVKGIWGNPKEIGTTTVRVEVFCDDPDTMIASALEAGAAGSLKDLKDHQRPWGIHRQGGFTDPFGHIWLIGDRSLKQFGN